MHAHQLTDIEAIKSFVKGGKAHFTLVSHTSRERITFRARASDDRSCFFVSVMTGSSNETDYDFIGTIFETQRPSAFMYSTRRAKLPETDHRVKAFRWFWDNITRGTFRQIDFWHEGRCCRCHRKLTTPASIESGIGPECAKK